MRSATALLALFFMTSTVICHEVNTFDPEYGVFLGDLSNNGVDAGLSGQVFLVNASTIQIFNFTFNGHHPDVYFWLDTKDAPSNDGLKIPTFEYGITPLDKYDLQERVVLNIPPPHKIVDKTQPFKSLSLYSYANEHNFGSIVIPDNLIIPRSQSFGSELKGSRYNLRSGPIYVVDKRTIKIYGFTFEGDRAPDTYFAVGRGTTVTYDAGIRVAIRGKDDAGITQITDNYRGGTDIVLDLPEDYDIHHIDWLAVYCYKYRVNFGHVTVPSNISNQIPPYVPRQKRGDDQPTPPDSWPRQVLLGTNARKNFTFQLGHSGGEKGYKAYSHMRTGKYVWYVNGLMSPDLYLKRGETYNFFVEGGNEPETINLYNPLYVSADREGGFDKLSKEEQQKIVFYTDGDANSHAGKLCAWSNEEVNPDVFSTFNDFRKSLILNCDPGTQRGFLQFTSNSTTPDVLYYQSSSNFNMGGRIFIVNEMPQNVTDVMEEPFEYEEYLKKLDKTSEINSAVVKFIFLIFSLGFAPLLL
ncbi:unnamed protein product [Caenorhabditis auriculariae]|uniref:DM13 domain-containing protein n=1 Tax=Caenorhabditis auriculariae TaxID=2777116 RepID=A0A8S1H5J5_9PELO|nr:unnamed protein product [Caenorhabditis auriculariae]